MRKLILTNYQAPGDILMLTAALRDLHHCFPNQFLTDVRTSCPELWQNNPYLVPLASTDPEVESLHCEYPLIHQSDRRAVHFLHGFMDFLNAQLNLQIRPSLFKGDIHLSETEKATPSIVEQMAGLDVPYWVVVAGGKYDFTIKWWHFRRWQAVLNHFERRILFVQIGKADDYHPGLHNVIDLRNRTSLRNVVHLVYHAQGVF